MKSNNGLSIREMTEYLLHRFAPPLLGDPENGYLAAPEGWEVDHDSEGTDEWFILTRTDNSLKMEKNVSGHDIEFIIKKGETVVYHNRWSNGNGTGKSENSLLYLHGTWEETVRELYRQYKS